MTDPQQLADALNRQCSMGRADLTGDAGIIRAVGHENTTQWDVVQVGLLTDALAAEGYVIFKLEDLPKMWEATSKPTNMIFTQLKPNDCEVCEEGGYSEVLTRTNGETVRVPHELICTN